MYPRTTYLSKKVKGSFCKTTPFIVRPVIVTGYTDAISLEYFIHRWLNVGYELSHKYHTLKGYEAIPVQKMKCDLDYEEVMKQKHGFLKNYKVINKPITLKQYYKEIGYDYKTKKIDGLTLRQYITKYIKGK